jgi:hypothetical protein
MEQNRSLHGYIDVLCEQVSLSQLGVHQLI